MTCRVISLPIDPAAPEIKTTLSFMLFLICSLFNSMGFLPNKSSILMSLTCFAEN